MQLHRIAMIDAASNQICAAAQGKSARVSVNFARDAKARRECESELVVSRFT